ncbi:MAG: hypothetical protein JWP46_3995 [Modestobacter sp.]|nr:hypothetical protein [Modestobacter sp.]
MAGLWWLIDELVPDGLWERVEPLLPPRPRRQGYPARRPVDDPVAPAGIVFVLKTASPRTSGQVGCSVTGG